MKLSNTRPVTVHATHIGKAKMSKMDCGCKENARTMGTTVKEGKDGHGHYDPYENFMGPCDLKQEDMVNQPSHYNYGEIECIDAIRACLGEEGFKSYCRGNALKYTWRAGLKLNTQEDLQKAAWYNRMAAGDDPRKDSITLTGEDAARFVDAIVHPPEPSDALIEAAERYKDAIDKGELGVTDEQSRSRR